MRFFYYKTIKLLPRLWLLDLTNHRSLDRRMQKKDQETRKLWVLHFSKKTEELRWGWQTLSHKGGLFGKKKLESQIDVNWVTCSRISSSVSHGHHGGPENEFNLLLAMKLEAVPPTIRSRISKNHTCTLAHPLAHMHSHTHIHTHTCTRTSNLSNTHAHLYTCTHHNFKH